MRGADALGLVGHGYGVARSTRGFQGWRCRRNYGSTVLYAKRRPFREEVARI